MMRVSCKFRRGGQGGASAPLRVGPGHQMPAADVAQDLAPRRFAQRVDRAWHLARQTRQRRPFEPRVGHRHRRHQPPGIGVLRVAEDLRAGAHLDHLAHEHHRHPVRDVLDHRHVMADEEIGDAELAFQRREQVEHPRLHRDIQRRDALVGDDQLRLQRKGAGDADPLALKPKLIICDESVSALDVSVQARVLALLETLKQEFGIAYLFISHDMAVVENISDRIGVMYLGQIVELGTRAQIFSNPQHPYTRRLIAAVPVPDPTAARKTPPRLTGEVPSPIWPVDAGPERLVLRDIGHGHLVADWADADQATAA